MRSIKYNPENNTAYIAMTDKCKVKGSLYILNLTTGTVDGVDLTEAPNWEPKVIETTFLEELKKI